MQITIDTKLKLLAGLPITVETFGLIRPLILKEIIEYGYDKYIRMLNMMCLTNEHFGENLPKEFNEFDVLLLVSDDEVKGFLKESLQLFLQDEIHLFPENQVIAVGTNEKDLRIINRKNFLDIRKIIQLQNYVLSVEDSENVSLKDEKAKEVAERMRKAREEVKRIKNKDNLEEESDFFDLLSSISSKSNSMNKIELLNLTIFQIYEEFKRLNHIDQYQTNIMAMLQGAKNIKLKHWSSKIKI